MQRVDKWLWFARFYKSRTLAATMVEDGRVRINGERAAKSAQNVRVGDVLTFAAGPRVRIIRVVAIGERRGPATEAQTLYEDLDPPQPKDVASKDDTSPRSARPTKKGRRDILAFTRRVSDDD